MSKPSGCGDIPEVQLDTSQADAALDQLRDHAQMTVSETFTLMNKSYQSLVLLGDIFGLVIPNWFTMMINSVFMMGKTMLTVASAESMTGIGLLQATFAFTAASLLFAQGALLLQARSEATDKLHTTMQLLNLWAY